MYRILAALTTLFLACEARAQVYITPADPEVCAGTMIEFTAQGGTSAGDVQYQWCELYDGPNGGWFVLGYGPTLSYQAYYDATIALYAVYYDPVTGDSITQIVQTSVSVFDIEAWVNSTDASCYTCPNGSFTLEVNGDRPPFTFAFNGTTTSNPVFTGLTPGQYIVTIIDGGGCSTEAWAWIGYVPSFQVDLGPEFVEIDCGDSITLTLNVNPPGNYNNVWWVYNPNTWEETQYVNQSSITLSGGGMVRVEVTDPSTGETNYQSVFVQTPALPVTGTVTDASCSECTDGAISVSASGTPPFAYYWHPGGQTTAEISGLAPGHYDVQVIDATGCSGWGTFTVGPMPVDPTGWLPTDEHVFIECGETEPVVIHAYPPPGVNAESIFWFDENGNVVGFGTEIEFLATYSQSLRVVAQGFNGQMYYGYVWVSVEGPEIVLTQSNPPSCEECTDGTAFFVVHDAVPPLTVEFNGESLSFTTTNFTLEGLGSGSYQIWVTDAEGCTGTTWFSLFQDTAAVFEAEITGPASAGCGQTVTLVGHAPEPAVQVHFWLNESGDTLGYGTELTVVVHQTTTFKFVSVNTATGERWEGTHNVTVAGFEVSGTVVNAGCETCQDGQITLTNLGGTPPYSFLWSNGATTQNVGGLAPGYYWVTVQDASGCSASAEFVVGCQGGSVAINGLVVFSDSTHASALVKLLAYYPQTGEIVVVDTQTTNASGYYSFQTPLGNGSVYYVLVEAQAEGYIPTYYPSSCVIQDAQAIEAVGCTQHFAVVEMIALTENEGEGEIDGVAVGDGSGKTAEEQAVSGLPLILMHAGKPVRRIVTDAMGRFAFKTLAMGVYRIFADKMGVNNSAAPTVTLSADLPTASFTLVVHSDRLEIRQTTDRRNFGALPGVTLYPNPAREGFTLRFETPISATLEILDLTGKTVVARSGGALQEVVVSTDSLSRGLYMVRVRSGADVATFRLVLE